jgi:hypothetical protein
MAGAPAGVASAPVAGGMVPFLFGANQYAEKLNTNGSTSQLLDAATHEFSFNVNPGGFLRGVRLIVSSTGGALGGGAVTADVPWNVFNSVQLDNIDGAPIIHPMPGYTAFLRLLFTRPWLGDPSRRFDFSATINPAFGLFFGPELKDTAAVLANTDARAQYRIKWTIATLATIVTGGAPTAPTVTVTPFVETWAQPDAKDLHDRPIENLPPGLAMTSLTRRQILGFQAAGADNTFQLANTGNELRCIIFCARNSSQVRTDLLGPVTRWRLDSRSLGVFSPEEIFHRMHDHYEFLQNGSTRPTGVYVFPRFKDKGRQVGEPWAVTANSTYMLWETVTAAGGTNGSLEIVTDEVVPVGPLDFQFESI